MFRTLTSWFCVILLVSQTGCAHKATPPLTVEARARLGTVGIVPVKFQPDVDLSVPAKGWLGGAGRKSIRWGGNAALAPFAGNCAGDRSGLCAMFLTALSVTAGTIGGLAGGVAGAFQATPSKEVRFSEEVITTAIASLNMQEDLCRRVSEVAQSKTLNHILLIAEQNPPVAEEKDRYSPLAAKGIDTVLEISVLRLALAGDWDIDPPLQYQMISHLSLIRAVGGARMYETDIGYQGKSVTFAAWADNNAQALFEQMDEALQTTAESIVRKVFLVNPEPAIETSGPHHRPDSLIDGTGSSYQSLPGRIVGQTILSKPGPAPIKSIEN